jgi:hypothetical protein
MDINLLFQRIVEWCDARNIHFKTTHREAPLKLTGLRAVKGQRLKLFFQDGVSFVAKGVRVVRDQTTAPFDLLLRALETAVPATRDHNRHEPRPIIITLFSLFTLFSVFALFSLIKLL